MKRLFEVVLNNKRLDPPAFFDKKMEAKKLRDSFSSKGAKIIPGPDHRNFKGRAVK
jgi:hypothetical protein